MRISFPLSRALKTKHIYEFGSYRLDTEEKLLVRDGRAVSLPPKDLETLVVLHKEGVHNSMTIFDINENKKYGAYISGTCYVQTKQCKTEEEWRALIKPFMED